MAVNIANIFTAVNAANELLPEAVNLIVSLRTPKGDTILTDLDAAEAQVIINEAEAQAFLDEGKDK